MKKIEKLKKEIDKNLEKTFKILRLQKIEGKNRNKNLLGISLGLS
jgi:hypothetical protein